MNGCIRFEAFLIDMYAKCVCLIYGFIVGNENGFFKADWNRKLMIRNQQKGNVCWLLKQLKYFI